MSLRLLTSALKGDLDIVIARKRTRRLAELIGFDPQDQTRITTAVSEIARNALEYAGGGIVEFRLTDAAAQQSFEIMVIDRGAGIAHLDGILDGSVRSTTGMGKGLIGASQFEASGLFATLRGMLRPLLVGDNVVLVFEEPADIPPLVTDEPKLSQILRNFISNAIKFTEDGEVRIWAAYDPDADSITFSVRDTGIGIAESDHEIIFQEFGQVANALQHRVKGTGLGLPLSKQLAELLGGGVALQSAPGQGSVFSVTIPRLYRTAGEAEDQTLTWQAQPGRVPILILILEDDAADVFAFERIFAPSPYQPFVARTIDQARRAIGQLRPAAVLLDVMLQGEESWRFLIELRQRDATANIPIAVISSTGDERKAINLGADEYVGKPVDAEQLVSLLDRMTGRSSVTRVLVVDDEEVSRYLVRQLLPRGLYDIREAATGIEGLAQVRDNRPDIVLFDLNMPGMDGYQFLERLDAEAAVPAIVLTSMILNSEQRGRLSRAANIVSKSDLSSPMLTAAIGGALPGSGAAA